jgi:hypothetical protein
VAIPKSYFGVFVDFSAGTVRNLEALARLYSIIRRTFKGLTGD